MNKKMVFLDPVLNPVLQPLLNASPFWGIFVMAFVITLLITIAYKFFTNQTEMKRLKDQQKEYQKKMKELKSNPPEMMKVQKEAMKLNMQYMKQSFKVTFITFIPIILIFGWMSAHLAYEPVYPGERFGVTGIFAEGVTGDAELLVDKGTELLSDANQPINSEVTWNLKSDEGPHIFTIKTSNDEQSKKVLITKELKYEEAVAFFEHTDIEQIKINYKKLKPLGKQSLFGWQPGWLGIYIILSIVFSIGLRKILKIY